MLLFANAIHLLHVVYFDLSQCVGAIGAWGIDQLMVLCYDPTDACRLLADSKWLHCDHVLMMILV